MIPLSLATTRLPFHVMAKPIGPICNLDCAYCFYLEKEKLYPAGESFRMTDAVLEAFVRQYIADQDADEITFGWQGGEPTLMGIDFFRRAVELQRGYADGKTVRNTLQTNATLIDDEWAAFLAANDFLVGVSVDGPPELHDRYRVDRQQRPTFDSVVRGLDCLKKHGAAFNTLTVVHRENAREALAVYRFLREIGSGHMQFIPLVERRPDDAARSLGLDFAGPAAVSPVTDWSVEPDQYGEFLVSIFEEWVLRDVGDVFVQLFDVTLGNWLRLGSGMCVFAERCGRALALEHNGDLYACDHYVYPDYKLGNILDRPLGELVASTEQVKFGEDKHDTLPRYCRECDVQFACHGECPKHRFATTPDGEPGLNYLCPSYKRFFTHVGPYMEAMAGLVRARRPASDIMAVIAGHERSAVWDAAGPADACPCGSGRAFGECCQTRREMTGASS
jgi:uncharacterized protein